MSEAKAPLLDRLRHSRKWPPHWPIQWKLAAVSAGITFIILVAFGAVVGQITTNQLRDNYEADTNAKAEELVDNLGDASYFTPAAASNPDEVIATLDSVNGSGDVILGGGGRFRPAKSFNLGPEVHPGISTFHGWQVATLPLLVEAPGLIPGQTQVQQVGWVRYGRSLQRLEASIGRIWFAIGAGALAASLLAALGGVILSRRAMRPISALTSTAGQIARTRDPDVSLVEPEGDDEVAELTRTFNDMLHELSIARTEREQSMQRQREFIADASHELRTPLTSVLANLELLEDSLARSGGNGSSRELEIESVESALRSSQRMKRLVADLQILARADAGRTVEPTECDLAEIAANVADELRPLSDHHEIVLQNPEPVPVSGIPDELHRVILNLVDNAIRHTPEGTSITVTSRCDGDMAEIRVEDDGPGIPRELWPQIFNRFVRNTGPGDRARGKGTGLGLAIVRVIARSHGGTATVGDSPQGGASFVIRLPLLRTSRKPLGQL